MLSTSRPCIAPSGCAVVGEASDQTFLLLRCVGILTRWGQRQYGAPYGVFVNDFPEGWVPIGAKKHYWYASTENGKPERFMLRYVPPKQVPITLGIALDWKQEDSLPFPLTADGWIVSQGGKAWSLRLKKGTLSGKALQSLCAGLGEYLASLLDTNQMRYTRQSLSMNNSATAQQLSLEWDMARDHVRQNAHTFTSQSLVDLATHLRWNTQLTEALRILDYLTSRTAT